MALSKQLACADDRLVCETLVHSVTSSFPPRKTSRMLWNIHTFIEILNFHAANIIATNGLAQCIVRISLTGQGLWKRLIHVAIGKSCGSLFLSMSIVAHSIMRARCILINCGSTPDYKKTGDQADVLECNTSNLWQKTKIR